MVGCFYIEEYVNILPLNIRGGFQCVNILFSFSFFNSSVVLKPSSGEPHELFYNVFLFVEK